MPIEKTAQKKFFGGVAVLMPATLLTKIIGLFYKVPLLTIVGVEGMAYFLSAYHIYSLLFVLAAAGLPTALSLLVSKAVAAGQEEGAGQIFRLALALFFLLGLAGSGILILCRRGIATLLAMPDAASSLLAIAPALALSAFTGAARGWFQGHRTMWPTAVSEVLEAVGKLVFGLLFADMAIRRGYAIPQVAAAAIFGMTAGVFLSALFLFFLLVGKSYAAGESKPLPYAPRQALAALFRVALPVTVSASVMSLVSLVDTVLISAKLQQAGFAPGVANALYSSYGNLAVPLYNLVPALLSPVAVAMVPTLSAAAAKGDAVGVKQTFGAGLRMSCLLAMPATLGLAAFSEPLLALLYRDSSAVAAAAPLLALLGCAVLPAVLIALYSAALQAAGHAGFPVAAMLAGAFVKLAVEGLLLPVPSVGILAAPISTLGCNLTVLCLEAVALRHCLSGHLLSAGDLYRPFGAAAVAVGCGLLAYRALLPHMGKGTLLTIFILGICGLVYLPAILLFRALRQADLQSLPGGEQIGAFLAHHHLLQEVEKDDKRRKNGSNFEKKHI